MSRIDSLPPDEASGPVFAIFEEIEVAFGMVPNIFRTYAHHPPLLEANWHKVKRLMMEGNLSRKLKEAIAVLVSKDNGCDYCVAAHTTVLLSVGVSKEEISIIEENLDQAEFTDKEKALIQFARKANLAPLEIGKKEFAALIEAGATDSEIVEALGVMEIFTGFNKFLDSLQVDIDF